MAERPGEQQVAVFAFFFHLLVTLSPGILAAMRHFLIALLATACSLAATRAEKLNLLIITVDDMSCDSVGVYGCGKP